MDRCARRRRRRNGQSHSARHYRDRAGASARKFSREERPRPRLPIAPRMATTDRCGNRDTRSCIRWRRRDARTHEATRRRARRWGRSEPETSQPALNHPDHCRFAPRTIGDRQCDVFPVLSLRTSTDHHSEPCSTYRSSPHLSDRRWSLPCASVWRPIPAMSGCTPCPPREDPPDAGRPPRASIRPAGAGAWPRA